MKKLLTLVISLCLFILSPSEVGARDLVVSASGSLRNQAVFDKVDLRKARLEDFFKRYNSPLAKEAENFVNYADLYHIDWRMVPAISGVESTFGKRIPHGSYNAYGWANGEYYFKSWEESIEVVSRTLREKYYNKGADDIAKIARRYAPPSSTWGRNVKFFMEKIDPTPVEFDI